MKKKYIYSGGIFLLSLLSFSQSKNLDISKGDKLFQQHAYFKSTEIYEKVANKGYKSVELFEKLGDSYFFNAEYLEANIWYTKLFELSKDVAPIYYYRYSQTLKSVSDNENSNIYLQQFSDLNKTDSRSEFYSKSKDYLSNIEDQSNRYIIEEAGVNSSYSDFGSAIFNNKLVFTSTRLPKKNIQKDDWTLDYYCSLYDAPLGKDNSLGKTEAFAIETQSKYHESDPVFTKDGKTMYFTRSELSKSNKKSEKAMRLKIYKANFINGKWDNVTALGFNSNAFNCAHPALSPDDKTLYFVSDMPGGYGDTDIYKMPVAVEMNATGMVNLGSNVNTSGKETFPWVSSDNQLYFASDGHLGLGGLDIFVTKIENNAFTSPVNNVGKPINSQFDDFGFIHLENSKSGFFTSNREGGAGKDDIYRFTEIMPVSKITGLVIDNETNETISTPFVSLYDYNHNLVSTLNADDLGRFDISPGVRYIKAEKADYETKEIEAKINDKFYAEKQIIIGLDKASKSIKKGDDLAKLLNIKNIYYDLNKYAIRSDAEVELQKIIEVMKQFPEMKISIGSYTDSRQTSQYNLALSKKRAKSARTYLISKGGIVASRITAEGYGETKLLNGCSDGVQCTEEEHQVNRRSEFIITK